jgi:hypothetical protein
LSKVIYLKAKKAPTINPGVETINIELDLTDKAMSTPRSAEASEAIKNIKI